MSTRVLNVPVVKSKWARVKGRKAYLLQQELMRRLIEQGKAFDADHREHVLLYKAVEGNFHRVYSAMDRHAISGYIVYLATNFKGHSGKPSGKRKERFEDIEDPIKWLPEAIFWAAVAVSVGGLLCLLN